MIFSLWLALGLAGGALADVLVFAAVSTKGPLDELAEAFEGETGIKVRLSYAASSQLARQIEFGAPAELFISANPAWMDYLQERDKIWARSRQVIIENRLVLVAHPAQVPFRFNKPEDLSEILNEDKLAVALTDAVPAGLYAKAALQSLGKWEGLRGQLVETDNVRSALQLVARGDVPFGITYASDAASSKAVVKLCTFPRELHPPIRYPAAVIKGASGEARAFMDYLTSPYARVIFLSHGFGDLGE